MYDSDAVTMFRLSSSPHHVSLVEFPDLVPVRDKQIRPQLSPLSIPEGGRKDSGDSHSHDRLLPFGSLRSSANVLRRPASCPFSLLLLLRLERELPLLPMLPRSPHALVVCGFAAP